VNESAAVAKVATELARDMLRWEPIVPTVSGALNAVGGADLDGASTFEGLWSSAIDDDAIAELDLSFASLATGSDEIMVTLASLTAFAAPAGESGLDCNVVPSAPLGSGKAVRLDEEAPVEPGSDARSCGATIVLAWLSSCKWTGSLLSVEEVGLCLDWLVSGLGSCDSEDPDLGTSSKSGGGSRSALDVLAANAIASAPYGNPNRAMDSREEINFTCSGVGPDCGYVNWVRMAVCVSGDEMELREIMEGELRLFNECIAGFDFFRFMGRKLLRIELEPD
jgi:hypothetical protein